MARLTRVECSEAIYKGNKPLSEDKGWYDKFVYYNLPGVKATEHDHLACTYPSVLSKCGREYKVAAEPSDGKTFFRPADGRVHDKTSFTLTNMTSFAQYLRGLEKVGRNEDAANKLFDSAEKNRLNRRLNVI